MSAKRAKRINRKSKQPIDRLYRAVQEYVEEQGGIVMAGAGVAIQHWPWDGASNFQVVINCIGNLPPKPTPPAANEH